MGTNEVLFSPIPIDRLQHQIAESVMQDIKPILAQITTPSPETQFLSRNEAAKMLSVSIPTLWKLTKKGVVKGYRIGANVRYKKHELEKAATQILTR